MQHGSIERRLSQSDCGDHKRALCLLDPYNIDVKWEVIEAAGKSRTLNFMIMDVNRNAMRLDPDKSVANRVAQMTRL